MAIDNEKIKALLEQRQKLRQGLAELRKDIDALDASAISVITEAGQEQQVQQAPAGQNDAAAAASPVSEDKTASVTSEPSAQASKTGSQTASTDQTSAPIVEKSAIVQDSLNKTSTAMTDDVSPIQATSSATAAPRHQLRSPGQTAGAPTSAGGASGSAQGADHKKDAADDKALLEHARLLAAYFIEHPAPVNNADLIALDMALDHYDQASSANDRQKAKIAVKDSYRTVASASYSLLGINGQTLADSLKGSWLIWAVPLLITALVLAAIPLGTLVVSLTDQMLAPDFASEVRWILGVFLAFFWGFVGALALIAYRFSSDIALGSYRAKGGHSVGLWGGMGGLAGSIIYLLVQWLFDFTGVEAGFAIDIGAFIAGMFSRLLFELLAKLVGLFTHGGKDRKPA